MLLILLLFSGGVIGLYFQGPGMRAVFGWTALEPGAGARSPIAVPLERVPSAERVANMGTGDVIALGRIRPRGGIISVALPQGAGDARIDALDVSEGDLVVEGQVLAILDSLTQFEGALLAAETARDLRRAILAQTNTEVATAEAETRAQLVGAEAALAAAEMERARVEGLLERGATTPAVFEDADFAVVAAATDLARLEAVLTRYQPGADGLQADVAVATADLDAAEATLAQARRDLDRARVFAPRDGTIIDIAARAGERAPAEGLLRLGNTERMEVELEVFQTNAPRVALGQSVSISSGVLGAEPLTGRVVRVGTFVGRQSITDDDPAANTDARVLEVLVELDEASSRRAAGFVNLEVIARIAVDERASR